MKAQKFIKSNSEEAKAIVVNYTKLDKDIINETWSNYNFGIGINKGFIQLCNEESQWAIESGKYPQGTAIPDYTNIVYFNFVKDLNSSISNK
jgi:hypothetical protein